MTDARLRTIYGIVFVVVGTATLVSGVLFVVMDVASGHGLDAPNDAFISCFGLGLLASGYGARWGSAYRWPQILAVLALVACVVVELSQIIGRWEQAFYNGNISNLLMSLLFLLIVSVEPRLSVDDQQKRSR